MTMPCDSLEAVVSRRCSGSNSDELSRDRRKRKFTEEDMAEYLTKKARRVAVKLKSDPFVWLKKIERDLFKGVSLDEFSVKAEKRRQRERKAEMEKLKREREERAIQKARRDEQRMFLARSRSEFVDPKKKEDTLEILEAKLVSEQSDEEEEEEVEEEVAVVDEVDESGVRKPQFFTHVHTGYDWNKYNRIHYDHQNPPPKVVKGYKFDIFYPDLVDRSKAPSYTIEKDEDSADTCIIHFHAGAPYEDLRFRIVNHEWEYSKKNGFKCTFDNGVLRLYFNLKRYRYRS